MSASTEVFLTKILQRLLTFVPTTTTTLNSLLGGRLYYDQAPAVGSVLPAYPFATYRLTNRVETEGFAGMRESADVELMIFGRPRGTQLWTAERCADVADEALLAWRDVQIGVQFSRFRTRGTLPIPPDPLDRDLVTVRCLYPVVLWPTYRTAYA